VDYRLVVAGANIVLASAAAFAYGVLAQVPQAVGASIGGVVAGSTIMALGVAAPQGPAAGLAWYSKGLARFLAAILAQADVAGHPARAAPARDGVIVYWSPTPLPAEALKPGVGVAGGVQYAALPPARLLEPGEEPGEALAHRLGLAQRLRVTRDSGNIVFDYEGVPGAARALAGSPTGPHALASLVAAAEAGQAHATLSEVDAVEDRVRVVLSLERGPG